LVCVFELCSNPNLLLEQVPARRLDLEVEDLELQLALDLVQVLQHQALEVEASMRPSPQDLDSASPVLVALGLQQAHLALDPQARLLEVADNLLSEVVQLLVSHNKRPGLPLGAVGLGSLSRAVLEVLEVALALRLRVDSVVSGAKADSELKEYRVEALAQ
jgi:hypothetical protein